jgi:hypothetical protein
VQDEPRFFLEKTMVVGTPYRSNPGLQLGQALISPQRSAGGSDIYKLMRELKPGDIVLHLVDNKAIVGYSMVASVHEEHRMGPEMWYRVPLREYRQLTPPLLREYFFAGKIGAELVRIARSGQKHLFYTRKLTLLQGAYLTPLPSNVVSALEQAYRSATGQRLLTAS